MTGLQARDNNRGGAERNHDKQHFQKPAAQQGEYTQCDCIFCY